MSRSGNKSGGRVRSRPGTGGGGKPRPDTAPIADPAADFARAAQGQDWPAAEAALGLLLKTNPRNASLHYNLALVLKHQGRLDEALAAIGAALALEPAHQGALFEQAACSMDSGLLEAALDAFTTYLARFPEDTDARLNRARLLLRLGRAAEALADCDAVSQKTPDLLLVRAEALRDLGLLAEADAILRPLYRDAPALRPLIVKLMTQGSKGRVPLNASTLGG
ncbi:tetratricopeptide repeat protein [Breoghania sp. L-A4]|uniref:tetratricopeptide repeat protein n=1 Tax=Breoghania sp. L-A4 TaxID=2304600 RepID=UPI0013C2D141|nr:tetratricopeptide repeat protein [Breoghania sp. L-A4]